MKFGFHILDYKFMGNYHYMSHIINFGFLFLLDKKNTLRLFVILFYVAAGSIKFNTDWLSGLSMTAPPIVSGKVLEWLCAYAVFMELFVVLFLLSERRWAKYFALFNLVVFHLFSWHIVGYFYPFMMFCLLSIFVLHRDRFSFPANSISRLSLAVFVAAQLYPLMFEPHSSLNGRGRILSLNMLDAYTFCETHFIIRSDGQWVEHVKRFDQLGVRIHCDMVMVKDYADKICQDFQGRPGFIDIDLDHQVRRRSNPEVTEQITAKSICHSPLKIGLLGKVYQEDEPND